MVSKVRAMATDWSYDVVSVGYPGPVAGNRPLREPHNLGVGWQGYDFAKAFERPTKVVNDALMQALGGYDGGRMLFLGLGTCLGSAMVTEGVPESMELGHLPYRKHNYEHYVGAAGLKRLGLKKWQQKVAEVVEDWRPLCNLSTSSSAEAMQTRSQRSLRVLDEGTPKMRLRGASGFGKRA
jgi:polyphosphate glucokinase